MGCKYEIVAARYPFKGYYEASFQTDSFLSAIWQLRKYQKQGYEIIDLYCRDINEWKFTRC